MPGVAETKSLGFEIRRCFSNVSAGRGFPVPVLFCEVQQPLCKNQGGIGRDFLPDQDCSGCADGGPVFAPAPCPCHGIAEQSERWSGCNKPRLAVGDKLGVSCNFCRDDGTPAQHGFDDCERQSFITGRQDEGVILFPDPGDI